MGSNRTLVLLLPLLSAIVALNAAWPSRASYNDKDLLDALKISRRNMCVITGGKCFSTSHCCNGLVCAAIDDYFGQKPEVPGYCVKEKDLKTCDSNTDCDVDGKCMALGRSDERYCLPKANDRANQQMRNNNNRPTNDNSKLAGGLGASCDDDSDCKPFTSDGSDRLCCQVVRRYRQKPRQQCDRLTAVSVCIPVRK